MSLGRIGYYGGDVLRIILGFMVGVGVISFLDWLDPKDAKPPVHIAIKDRTRCIEICVQTLKDKNIEPLETVIKDCEFMFRKDQCTLQNF